MYVYTYMYIYTYMVRVYTHSACLLSGLIMFAA